MRFCQHPESAPDFHNGPSAHSLPLHRPPLPRLFPSQAAGEKEVFQSDLTLAGPKVTPSHCSGLWVWLLENLSFARYLSPDYYRI